MKIYHKIRIWLAIKIEWLRPHLLTNKEQEKLIMLEFRSLALLFGFDISDMSDEEIKEGVTHAAKEMSKVGMSASEAGEALRRMVLA
jgi:hypothetical protein